MGAALRHAYTMEIRAKARAIKVPQSGCNQEQVCFIRNRNITSLCKCNSTLKREVASAALAMLKKSFPPLIQHFLRGLGDICSFCYLTAAKQTIRACKHS